jgi:glycosyltransferase involved in cell wall biosynthesis
MGTSIWYDNLRRSSLNESFDIHWFNVNVHQDFSTLGHSSLFKIWPNIRLFLRFRSLLMRSSPQLVLIPFSQTTPGFLKDSVFIRLAKRHARTLLMLHGSNIRAWLDSASPGIRTYFSRTLQNCSGVIVLGEKLKYLFKEWFTEDRIFVVPNGIDLPFPIIKKAHSDRVILRYLANPSTAKGIREVISAMEYLKDSKVPVELRINGAWREKDTMRWCQSIITSCTLPVIDEGPKFNEDKFKALVNSDIFIFTPNEPEGHPMVIVEAMAAGLPIIATDQGAITESVIQGLNGFIVKSNCPEEISDRLKYLIENPDVRVLMGLNSRRLYEQKFTEAIMIENLSSVFKYVLKNVD